MNAQSRPLLGDGGEWILNAIKKNPEGLLLLAAGAVLMMRTSSPQSSSRSSIDTAAAYGRAPDAASKTTTSPMADAVTDSVRRTVDVASTYASTASDTARQTMHAAKSYASSAAEYADQAKRVVGEQSDRVVRQTRSMAQGVLQNQPLAILAAGLASGAAMAAVFPPTELEKGALGPMGDQMSKAAERFGDQLKQATAKAGDKLKTAAEERGLHSEGLKDLAGEVVDTFKELMTGQTVPTRDTGPAAQPDSVDGSVMGNISLLQHEHEVERSRAKLTQDLAVLCSPATLAAFTDDLKQEAFETRDAFWEKIKARAASNPAAVMAIGAGLAWRLLRSPPIASALIGVGLFSLWKTQPRTAYDASGRRT